MTNFQSARNAKEFLIARVVEEAKGENIPLSEVEHKMLYFSETHWTIPDIASVSERFDREYNQDEYEEKIIRLIKEAAIHDHQQSAQQYDLSAATALRMAKRYGHIGNQALRAAADVLGETKLGVVQFAPPSLKKSPKSGEVQNVA